ncbi:MAG: hypothetical protein M2R45_02176 [Verrucomicrobia subdivision 3 bacterium]|nr:hypothetical protein [Limisphaerales bacterium]MCS1413752.1 hypothetical protein [Limisphaerales bacterium]
MQGELFTINTRIQELDDTERNSQTGIACAKKEG